MSKPILAKTRVEVTPGESVRIIRDCKVHVKSSHPHAVGFRRLQFQASSLTGSIWVSSVPRCWLLRCNVARLMLFFPAGSCIQPHNRSMQKSLNPLRRRTGG